MKAREIFEKVLGALMMICVIGGLLLMMCESADWNTQKLTLFGGAALFIIGIVPGVIIARRGETFG